MTKRTFLKGGLDKPAPCCYNNWVGREPAFLPSGCSAVGSAPGLGACRRRGRPRGQKGEAMGNYEAIFNLIGSILGGVMIGAFCGAISLIVGVIKKKKALGLIGFFVSIAFGIFMTTVLYQPAFLSIIPSAIFAGIIFILTKKSKKN